MSEKRRKKWTPSPAGIAMLENVVSGLPTTAGLRGRSEHGGAAWTELALRRHGLLGANGVTVEGYLAIAKSRSNAKSCASPSPKCLRDHHDEGMQGPCSAGLCAWPDCKSDKAEASRKTGVSMPALAPEMPS